MEDKLFDLLGLGVPFYLAAATYAVFSWLDSNASDEATKVISSWLHGRSHNKPDLGNLIVSAFDRVYTSPLLSFRAFRRSAAISISMWLLVFFVPWLMLFLSLYWKNDGQRGLRFLLAINSADVFELTLSLTLVILSDYISLFFVRRFLSLARIRPVIASIMSSVVGLLAVTIIFVLCFFIVLDLVYLFNPALRSTAGWTTTVDIANDVAFLKLVSMSLFLHTIAPALIIHLWLPLFALSSLAVRLLYLLFRAVEWAQWFLKQGDAHPLKAIGIVATIIVFASAMLVKEAWTVL